MTAGTNLKRRHGKTSTGRTIWEALHELADRDGHIISVGELFTLSATGTGGTVPICRDCRAFEMAAAT